jgi:hypothetical protein
MLMYNVSPAGKEELAVEATFANLVAQRGTQRE